MQSLESKPIRVLVIAPPLLGWTIAQVVEDASPHLLSVGKADSFAQALEVMQLQAVDVAVTLLLDYDPKALAQFCARSSAKVIALAAEADDSRLDTVVRGGVRGILGLSDPAEAVLKAVEQVHEGELWIDRGTTSRIFLRMAKQRAQQRDPESSKIAKLTLRERQTVAAVARHVSAPGKVLADRLCISEHTLRNHLSSIYTKLGLSSRLDLYAYATSHNLCAPEQGGALEDALSGQPSEISLARKPKPMQVDMGSSPT